MVSPPIRGSLLSTRPRVQDYESIRFSYQHRGRELPKSYVQQERECPQGGRLPGWNSSVPRRCISLLNKRCAPLDRLQSALGYFGAG